MSDAYRDRYEAALQQGESLRRENEDLRVRLSRYECADETGRTLPPPHSLPAARVDTHTGASVLAATLLSTALLAGAALIAATGPSRVHRNASPCPYSGGARAAETAERSPCPYVRAAHARWLAEQGEDATKATGDATDDTAWDEPSAGVHTPPPWQTPGTPAADTGDLRIELDGAVPTGAEVQVDRWGVYLRGRAATAERLPAGMHTVHVWAPGCERYDSEVLVHPGVRQTLAFSLTCNGAGQGTRDPFRR